MRIFQSEFFGSRIHNISKPFLGTAHMLSQSRRSIIGAIHKRCFQKIACTNLLTLFQALSIAKSRTRTTDSGSWYIDRFFINRYELIKILYSFNGDSSGKKFCEGSNLSFLVSILLIENISRIRIQNNRSMSCRYIKTWRGWTKNWLKSSC